jgi:hypothetical protein
LHFKEPEKAVKGLAVLNHAAALVKEEISDVSLGSIP